MRAKTAFWLFLGFPALVLGVIIMMTTGASPGVAMPIALGTVVVGWVALIASASPKKGSMFGTAHNLCEKDYRIYLRKKSQDIPDAKLVALAQSNATNSGRRVCWG
jgi:hypothetical protein